MLDKMFLALVFPVSSFENANTKEYLSIKQQLLNIGGRITENGDNVGFSNIEWKTLPDYEKWCSLQKEKQLENVKRDTETTYGYEILRQRIMNFQIVNKTPMQAFGSIMELQTGLK